MKFEVEVGDECQHSADGGKLSDGGVSLEVVDHVALLVAAHHESDFPLDDTAVGAALGFEHEAAADEIRAVG